MGWYNDRLLSAFHANEASHDAPETDILADAANGR